MSLLSVPRLLAQCPSVFYPSVDLTELVGLDKENIFAARYPSYEPLDLNWVEFTSPLSRSKVVTAASRLTVFEPQSNISDKKFEKACQYSQAILASGFESGVKIIIYHCPDKTNPMLKLKSSSVNIDRDEAAIGSSLYSFDYKKNNPFLFRYLKVKHEGKSLIAAEDANYYMYLDLKHFFDLDFGSRDLSSNIQDQIVSNRSFVADLKFFLKVLFFKIDIKMESLSSFFEDSVNLPIIMDVPNEGSRFLGEDSGVLYSWKDAPSVKYVTESKKFSMFDYKKAKSFASLADQIKFAIKNNCKKNNCYYKIKGSAEGTPFVVRIRSPRYLTEAGFIPTLVTDVRKLVADKGWSKKEFKNIDQLTGLYLGIQNMPKGQHRIDYWFEVGDKHSKQPCVRSWSFKKL